MSAILFRPQMCEHIQAETNGRYFAEVIFKRIFFSENVWISIKISLKFLGVQLT